MADVEALIRDLEMAYSYRIETLGSAGDVDCDAQEELEKARDAIRAAVAPTATNKEAAELCKRLRHAAESARETNNWVGPNRYNRRHAEEELTEAANMIEALTRPAPESICAPAQHDENDASDVTAPSPSDGGRDLRSCAICGFTIDLTLGHTKPTISFTMAGRRGADDKAAVTPEIDLSGVVDRVMQETWDDICADTQCHPLDITHEGRKALSFHPGHWAAAIARNLSNELARMRGAAVPDMGALMQAVARGWCHPANASKTMDPDLVGAIAGEVSLLLAAAPEVPR